MPSSADAVQPPWWGVLSAAAAPILLIGGWTVAAGLRPGFDPVAETISALAAVGSPHRWVMTWALAGLGVAHVVTALALRPAAPPGRLLLGIGGLATVLVAAFPLSATGQSRAHAGAALVAFAALALWPALAGWRGGGSPPVLGVRVGVVASAALFGLLVWFAQQLVGAGPMTGLAERAAAGAQSLWPLVAVLGSRSTTRSPARAPARESAS